MLAGGALDLIVFKKALVGKMLEKMSEMLE
jgi:hypothetical protein